MPVVWLIVYGFFLAVFVVSTIMLFKKNWKPFGVQIITILLLFLIPFNQVVVDINFKVNQTERDGVKKSLQNKKTLD
jgi:uncharacterized membrane protein YccF (DUF307 family)